LIVARTYRHDDRSSRLAKSHDVTRTGDPTAIQEK
jgi:hypothetical protein